jgi:hypothetical protein
MAAGALVVVTGCASEDATTPATTSQETATATDTGPTAELGPATDTTTEPAVDPCTLVSDETLAELFPAGVPEPEGTIYGAGSSDCVWDDAPDALLALTLVPADAFASDFVDELASGSPVTSDELGPDAVSFRGVVTIDSALSDDTGATVGFVKDEAGALVAVGTAADDQSDLATATSVAEEVADGL